MNVNTSLLPASCTAPPRFKGKWVVPPRLKDVVDRLGDYRFLMLTARPGSGKTRLMARLHAELQTFLHACCWLRLGPQMARPGAVCRNIATSFVRSVLGEHSATAALLMGALPDSRMILTVALNEIAAFDGSVVLFLDDMQTVNVEEVADDLQLLLDHAPENLRVVMASRTLTRLKLARLRNDGLVLDLADEDFALSFKQLPEIVLDAGWPRPTLAELRELWHRAGGWVAGIRLLARGKMRDAAGARAEELRPLGRDVLDYFEEEVFSGLSDEARGALDIMLTPHQLVHDLMVELIGDAMADAHIAELETQGLLARQATGHRRRYRPAPLLVEATHAETFLPEEDRRALHRRCCDWFEKNGALDVAARHAVDAGDVDRAIALIERCGIDMISHGDVTELQSWLPLLPVEKLRERPVALLAIAWSLSLLYRLDEANALLAPLEEDIERDSGLRARLETNLSALRVMHLSMRDDILQASARGLEWRAREPGAGDWFGNVVDNSISFSLALAGEVDRGRLVLERAYLPDYYENNPYAAIYSRCILGLIDLRAGQVRRAEVNFAWAVKKAEADLDIGSTGAVMAAGLLAGACHERGDIARVNELMEGYAWSLHAHLFTDTRFHAYRAMARDLSRRGQYRAAISSLERVLDASPAVRLPRVHIDVLAEKVVIALEHHDSRTANAYNRALGGQLAALAPDDWLRPYAEATLFGSQAHLDIELGSPEGALPMLRRAIAMDLRGGWNLRAFHWTMLAVRALWRLESRDRAARLMDRLLGYAADAGIVRTILDGGHEIEAVLARLHERPVTEASPRKRQFLAQLRQAFDPALAPEAAQAGESTAPEQLLTEREIELIRFVRAGLTNRQIAERMRVSENTIKWHLKNVFEKVSVKRRSELANLVLS
jgi:LuxR family maltose regulon positive regulatory protein